MIEGESSACALPWDGPTGGTLVLSETPIRLRPVVLSDREHLFQWRNHPAVRQYSLQAQEIDWPSHCQWLEATLQNPLRVLLLGALNTEPVGVLRYDLSGDGGGSDAWVSVYLVPQRMGQGLGVPLLRAGHAWLSAHHPQVRQLNAQIVPANQASLKVFEKAGYQPVSPQTQQGILQYVYRF